MTITVRFWNTLPNMQPDYGKVHIIDFSGETAEECMKQVDNFRYNHDCRKYTPTEIINVRD